MIGSLGNYLSYFTWPGFLWGAQWFFFLFVVENIVLILVCYSGVLMDHFLQKFTGLISLLLCTDVLTPCIFAFQNISGLCPCGCLFVLVWVFTFLVPLSLFYPLLYIFSLQTQRWWEAIQCYHIQQILLEYPQSCDKFLGLYFYRGNLFVCIIVFIQLVL